MHNSFHIKQFQLTTFANKYKIYYLKVVKLKKYNLSSKFMNIRNINIYSFIKIFLLFGILILFLGSFLKLYISVPNNLSLRIIFIILYLWFTVGINVNFIMPLIGIIDKEINTRKR